jgi:hypothetical protein
MARERQGVWLSGLQEVKGGLDNPVNQAPTDWFAVQQSNLGTEVLYYNKNLKAVGMLYIASSSNDTFSQKRIL